MPGDCKDRELQKQRPRTSLILIPGLLILGASPVWALTLDEYLDQVRQKSPGFQSSVETTEAAKLRESNAQLIFSPTLFADGQLARDYSRPNPPLLSYDHVDSNSYSLGVGQQFSFGLQTKLSYELDYTSYAGAMFPGGAATSYHDARPVLEASLPLWQNGFGRSIRANRDLLTAQATAQKFAASAENQSVLLEAETAYWRLANARQAREIQVQALRQAQSILDYVSRKARMNLGENADTLQAKALVESRRFELNQAENEEANAARAFNLLRHSAEETVSETVQAPHTDQIYSLQVPSVRPGDRADVRAASAQNDLNHANSVNEAERNKPTLDLFGRYAFNGRDSTAQEAISDSFSNHRDTSAVGIRFSMPLDLSATRDGRRAAEKAALASDLRLQEKRFEQDRDWQDLVLKINQAKSSLKYAENIEQAQKLKLENEKARFKQGRTTTYQVLLFEQDYSQAQLLKVRATQQILSLYAQLKLYSPEQQ